MHIKLVSDVHTEFDRDYGDSFIDSLSTEGVDVLVVAGDLTSKYHERNLRRLCDKFKDVVYVTGNHDYWGSSLEERKKEVGSIKLPNLHWLQNTRKLIQDQWFVGTTLWFPECSRNRNWPDFRYVKEGPDGIFKEFNEAKKFLNDNVQKNDIVVTHHLPSQKCVAPCWVGERTNCYFVGDVEDIMIDKEPKLWLFGHTHNPRYLTIGKTVLYCNPRGYPNEGVSFDPNLIIESEQ